MIILTRPLAAAILALVVTGCGQASSSSIPGASSSASAAPTASPTVTPSATPTPTAVPTATPVPTAAASVAACPELPQTGLLPSDRFVGIEVATGASADRLTFAFGAESLPGPAAPPRGSLEVARPPYTQAGSGATIEMDGRRVVQVRFSGMSLSNDVGQPTYDGPPEVKPAFASLRHAVLFDASEGIIGWYVGYDGSGCVTLDTRGTTVTLVIEH